jgi:prevent-host-death family protein
MTDMVRVTASEFQRSFGQVSDRALKETVAITKQGRDHLVLLSAEEYARLKRRDRKVGLAGELSDEWLDAVRKAEAPQKRTRRLAPSK